MFCLLFTPVKIRMPWVYFAGQIQTETDKDKQRQTETDRDLRLSDRDGQKDPDIVTDRH